MRIITATILGILLASGYAFAQSSGVSAVPTGAKKKPTSENSSKSNNAGKKKKTKVLDQEQYEYYLQRAVIAEAQGNAVTAHALYRRAFRYPKRESKVFLALSRLDVQLNEIERAEKVLLLGLKEHPLSSALRYELVKLYMKLSQDVRAHQQLRRFPAKAREEARYKYYQALVAYRLGELSQSIEMFESLGSVQNPYQADAKYWLGYSFARKQEAKAAIAAFQEALAMESEPELINEILGMLDKLSPKSKSDKLVVSFAAGTEYDSNVLLGSTTDAQDKDTVKFFGLGSLRYNPVRWDKGNWGIGGTLYQNYNMKLGNTADELSATFIELNSGVRWDIKPTVAYLTFDIGYQLSMLPLSSACPTGGIGCGGLKAVAFSQRAFQTLGFGYNTSKSHRLLFSLLHYTDVFGQGNDRTDAALDRDTDVIGNGEFKVRSLSLVSSFDITPRLALRRNSSDGTEQQFWAIEGGSTIGYTIAKKVRLGLDLSYIYRDYIVHSSSRKDRLIGAEANVRYQYSKSAGIAARVRHGNNTLADGNAFQYERWVAGISWDHRIAVKD